MLEGWRSRALFARAGVAAKGRLLEGRLVPRFQVNWIGTASSSRELPVRYAGAADSFLLPGVTPDRSLWQAGFACDWRVNEDCAASFSIGGTHGRQSRITSEFSAGLRYAF